MCATAPTAEGSPPDAPNQTDPDDFLEDADDEFNLPPLDSDEDDHDQAAEEHDELPPLADDPGADPFDDATAADLETGIDIDVEETSSDDNEPAEDRIDTGHLDDSLLTIGVNAGGDSDHDGMSDEDHEDSDIDDDGFNDDDGGAEGTGEAIEDEIEEDELPELDADEQGDYEEDVLADLLLMEATEGGLPPWEAMSWEIAEGAGAPVPCSALAIAAGRIVAAGDVVLIVDEGAHAVHKTSFGSGAVSVAVNEDMIVLGTRRGGLLVMPTGASSASPLAGWRSSSAPIDLAATPGRVWIRSGETLWSMSTPTTPPVLTRDRGVLAIASTGATLVALTRTSEGFALERLRGDDEGWQVTPLGTPERALLEAGSVKMAVAAGGRRIALGAKEGIRLSSDAALSFHSIALPGTIAMAFAGDDERAPLLSLVANEGDSTACMVQIPVEGAPARLISLGGASPAQAALPSDNPAFGPAAIAWDAARDLAWIACRAGLLAIGRARKH